MNYYKELGRIFLKTINMLEDEIDNNHEEINTFSDIGDLISEWNSVIDAAAEKNKWNK